MAHLKRNSMGTLRYKNVNALVLNCAVTCYGKTNKNLSDNKLTRTYHG